MSSSNSETCARPSSGGEMEVNEGELSEVEGVMKSSEPEHDKEVSGPVGRIFLCDSGSLPFGVSIFGGKLVGCS